MAVLTNGAERIYTASAASFEQVSFLQDTFLRRQVRFKLHFFEKANFFKTFCFEKATSFKATKESIQQGF